MASRESERTAVLVTGMHRTGTSALARTLSCLGAILPADLVPANEGNPRGHWEPRGMVELNDRMLGEARSDLYSVVGVDPSWFATAPARGFVEEAGRFIDASAEGRGLVVLKDPRTCLLLPIWHEALAARGYRVVHVLSLRHPLDVASSLRRRHLKTIPYDAWVPPRGEAVWLRYTLAAVLGSRGQRRVFLRYGDLLGDWRREAKRIGSELDIVWPRSGAETEREIDAFLHRNAEADGDHDRIEVDVRRLADLDLVELASFLYDTLTERGDDPAVVDVVAAAFAARIGGARDLLGTFEDLYPLVWHYFEASAAARQTPGSREAENAMRQTIQQTWSALTESNAARGALLHDVRSQDQRLAALQADLADLQAQFAILTAERDAAQDLAEDLRRQLDDETQAGEALRNSTSWRWTAPLRAVTRRVRRG